MRREVTGARTAQRRGDIMPVDRPRILLIMADQLTRRVLGTFGGPVPTPGLDCLREKGIDFVQTVTPFAVCSPARASIVIDLYPHTHAIVHNAMSQDYPMAAGDRVDLGITPSEQATEGILHHYSYHVTHRDKWHLSDQPLAYYPVMFREHQEYAVEMAAEFTAVRRAFAEHQQWYGWTLPVEVAPVVRMQRAALADTSDQRSARFEQFNWREEATWKMGKLPWPEATHFDVRATSAAIRSIEEAVNAGQPFMVTCSLNNPHDPNVAPDPYYSQFDPAAIDLPLSYGNCGEHHRACLSRRRFERWGEAGDREFLRIYYAQVAMVDRQIQRLLDALDRLRLTENTLVLFTSDHGDMAGAHGMTWKSTEAFYEEVVRVPLLLRWPAQLSSRVDERRVNLVDLQPTILDAAGVTPERPVQGHSLLRSAANGVWAYAISERIRHDSTTRQVAATDPLSIMLRTPQVQLVHYANGGEELFDLANDPLELTNRVADPSMAAERACLLRLLVSWMEQTAHPQVARYRQLITTQPFGLATVW